MAVTTSLLPRAAPAGQDATATQARRAQLRSCYRASALVGLLLAVAAGFGLFAPGLYQNNTAFAATAFRGTDLVSLAVTLPVLGGSLWLASRGSPRALLVWLGALGYVAYTYLYTFAIAWNRLFLVYVALLSLSLFTLARALLALDATELAGRFGDRTPVRGVGAFLWLIGGMLGLMELAQVAPALLTGQAPDVVLETGHPTGVIYILDLGLVVPLLLLAGHWVRQRRPFGYVAAAILLVKGVTVGLALLASNLFGYLDNGRTDGPLLGLWALIAVGCLLALVRYLQPMQDQPVRQVAGPPGKEAEMVRIEGEIAIDRPVDEVFDFVADERNEPRYNPRILRVHKLTPGPIGQGTRFGAETTTMGRTAGIAIQYTAYQRPRRLGSSIHMSAADIQGSLTFDPVAGGTRMGWTWDLRLRRWYQLLRPIIAWTGRRQEQATWASLKQYLEGQRDRLPNPR